MYFGASWVMLVVKNVPANAGDIRDPSSIPGSERFPGRGHGKPMKMLIMIYKILSLKLFKEKSYKVKILKNTGGGRFMGNENVTC